MAGSLNMVSLPKSPVLYVLLGNNACTFTLVWDAMNRFVISIIAFSGVHSLELFFLVNPYIINQKALWEY